MNAVTSKQDKRGGADGRENPSALSGWLDGDSMDRGIPEVDWRQLRKVDLLLLERCCQRALTKVETILRAPKTTAIDRFWDAHRFMEDQTKEVRRAFEDYRRSTAPRWFTMAGVLTLLAVVACSASPSTASAEPGWFAFAPAPDDFNKSPLDLRFLNEKFAGEHGFIQAKDGQFVHAATGEPVRFWGVNGPPHGLESDELKRCARTLAKRGVNLVRVHGRMFDREGEPDVEAVRHAHAVVAAMKAEGIYTHFSIYFPLWFSPRADHPWLEGYDGKQHPFAALFFHERFQEKYRSWWKALLATPDAATGRTLLEEPAVFGVELLNEDSFFFWTFAENRLPDAQWRRLERQFGDWLVKRYGSLDAALAKWKGQKVKRDQPAEGRMGFRPLWNMFSEKSPRDQDTAEFLLEVQTRFYADSIRSLRRLGFRGLITASNWSTASPEVLGPLEKLSYTTGDFLDRHGYFSCNHKGQDAEWSIRAGHTFCDRSALRFDGEDPTKPKQFLHPVMDPEYDGRPSMISETTFNRPNRYRSEAPLYYAVYGALQGGDAVVHFALDGTSWSVKPGFWMQPWTLMTPAMAGQFPAAALVYRRGLVQAGQVLAEVNLNRGDLIRLQGTPLPQDAAFDELRLKDVPGGSEVKPGQRLDPLLHYAGRAMVRFTDQPGSVSARDLQPYVNRSAQTVKSTTGELELDYGHGVLRCNAPQFQGASGNLQAVGRIALADIEIESSLDLGHIVAVALDGQPLGRSRRILLQAMSEEKGTGFQTEPTSTNTLRIVAIGASPWQVKAIEGTVRLKRSDATQCKVTALDFNGYPAGRHGTAQEIRLRPDTLYYWIER